MLNEINRPVITKKLIKLHPLDNVQIVVDELHAGDSILVNETEFYVPQSIGIGHKLAERLITAGEKIIKYGVPIGSATTDMAIGAHVHLHNMKSDYIPTYTLDKEFIDHKS